MSKTAPPRVVTSDAARPHYFGAEMKYLFLIYSDEKIETAMSQAEMGQLLQAYGAYTRGLQEKGVYKGGEPLQPVSTATSLRRREGKTLLTDGPFAETKEQLVGFYLVDCSNLDEALELAAGIPSAEFGTIEVRPVMDFTAMREAAG
jgi:hypothetical protein